MGRLAEKIKSGQKIITAEITPPKGAGIKKLLRHAELIRPYVDAINITDCQRALVKMSSMAACRVLLDHGVEPVYQLTCRDRNTIALQSDLMGASALGIPNLLCLTGDPVKVGDSPNSRSVFEVESIRLLQMAGLLQTGRDCSGEKMNAPTKFFVGAVVNPTLSGGASQLERMSKKQEAGASFFQTQANYDLDDFRAFLIQARERGAKVLAGILVLHTREIARFIRQNIPGIHMPDGVLARFETATNERQFGIDFAIESMLALRDFCQGFHLMTIREEELIPDLMEKYNAIGKSSP